MFFYVFGQLSENHRKSTSGRFRWLKEGKLFRLAAIPFISVPEAERRGSICLSPQFLPPSSFKASKAIVCPSFLSLRPSVSLH